MLALVYDSHQISDFSFNLFYIQYDLPVPTPDMASVITTTLFRTKDLDMNSMISL